MQKIIFTVFVCLICISCRGQAKQTDLTLHILNRSGTKIDSIDLPSNHIKIRNGLRAGDSTNLTIDGSSINSYQEGEWPLFYFQNGRKKSTSFGFHDMGIFARIEEYIYVFEHGVNNRDEPPRAPNTLSIILINKSKSKIDSIQALNSAIRKIRNEQTYLELVLDFNRFKNHPVLEFYQNGKVFKVPVSHDWEDWNNLQEFIYFYDNGVVSATEKNK